MKSLSFKLVLLYITSVLLIVVATVAYTEYMHTQQTNETASLMMEAGPVYVNGETPWDFENTVIQRGEKLSDVLNGLSNLTALKVYTNYIAGMGAGKGYEGFLPISNSSDIPGGVVFNTIVQGPITEPDQLSYKTYSLQVNNSKFGTILLTDNYFPTTINEYLDGQILRQLYYKPVPGYDGVIILASLDGRLPIVSNWWGAVSSDLLKVVPVLFLFSLILGWVISKTTVSPLKSITDTAEKMSGRNLNLRVEIKSKDEIGRLAHSFNDMADRLEKTFTAQKQFVSDAAHELRTPLASMKTALSLTLSKPREKEEYQELIEKLSSRLATIEKLTNDLLEQARADENISVKSDKSSELAFLLKEVAEGFNPLFQDREIKFELQTENNIYVRGDNKSLMRLFSNLLDNAAKNTAPGGSVNIHAYKRSGWAYVEVRDNGRGISQEHLDIIFERFYKVSGSGFGLGLSICRSIVLRYGGKITAESRLGEGSTFLVKLPLVRVVSGIIKNGSD
jgi:signal transduction histidine kinase